MPFVRKITIEAPASRVLDFVGDIHSMPKYMPTTTKAEPDGKERVHVEGKAKGHAYKADGYLRRRNDGLDWGADEGNYKGRMDVIEREGATEVTITLEFGDRFAGAGHRAPTEDDVQQGMAASLESIKNHVEGRGGKVEPPAAG